MARSGITKHLVTQARNRLVNKGIHPSIDAVRVELGDTGSKTTISRYLKEINQDNRSLLADAEQLSSSLSSLVSSLVEEIQQEAFAKISESASEFEVRISDLKGLNEQLGGELRKSNERTLSLTASIEDLSAKNASLTQNVAILDKELAQANLAVKEKSKRIASLEKSLQHSSDSLNHYRESVKEQREIDLQNNDRLTHDFNVRIDKLQQSLQVSRTEVTTLNRDNAELVSRLRESERQHLSAKRDSEELKASKSTLELALERFRERISHLQNRKSELEGLLDDEAKERSKLVKKLSKLKKLSKRAKKDGGDKSEVADKSASKK